MKTSNKILGALLVLVFLVPLLMASVLKSKVKKGEFTFVKGEIKSPGTERSRVLDSISVIDIAAPNPGLLHCNLRMTDNTKYVYYQNDLNDSLTVYQRNDTLFIRHPALVANTPPSSQSHFEINVFLPRLNALVLDGAGAFVDSLPSPSGSFNITLRNGGRVSNE